ncbi:polymerase [Anopheles sinensis]|uniref:Polymerase n=1 Tax=Anopheles sinensis TaxID=74873 RepID=A0A084VPW0_ANOSI|nr:polymerase [Anopheles sinensis]
MKRKDGFNCAPLGIAEDITIIPIPSIWPSTPKENLISPKFLVAKRPSTGVEENPTMLSFQLRGCDSISLMIALTKRHESGGSGVENAVTHTTSTRTLRHDDNTIYSSWEIASESPRRFICGIRSHVMELLENHAPSTEHLLRAAI